MTLIKRFFGDLSLEGQEIQSVSLEKISSNPSGFEGQIIYNTTDNLPKVYNGSAWEALSSGTVTSVGTGNGTFISGSGGPITGSGSLTYDLSATGTPGVSNFLRGDNSWIQLDHDTSLLNVGVNTHIQIDTHIGDVTTNPHAVTASDVGLGSVTNVPTSDIAYDQVGWDGNPDSATKNAIRDKVVTMDSAILLNTEYAAIGHLPLSGGTMTGTNGVLFPDNFKFNLGNSSDLQIYHDGFNSFIEDVGTGGLFLKSNGAGIYLKGFTSTDTYAQFLEGGSVNLYHNNSKKFETTSAGVTVTGDATANQFISTNNGNGQNYKIGDDVWIGDIDVANTFRVQGASNSNNGYITFGNLSNQALGRAGTGALTWGGAFEATTSVTSPTFLGDLNGTINTATTAVTQVNATDNTTVATTAFVQNLIGTIPAGLVFQGTWDAATNTPTLTSGTGTTGNFYIVSTSGSTNLDGVTDWVTGDWAVFIEQGGTDAWEKIDNSSVLDGVGTGNQITKWSGSGTSNTLTDSIITDDGTNVGIGTTSPSASLHVNGNSGSTATFEGSSQSTVNLLSGSANNYLVGTVVGFSFRPNGSTSTTMLANGNVGIGTASPLNKLQVTGGSVGIDSEYAIRDNRNNTLLQQSASTLASNRTLTIGNATYSNVVVPNGNVGIGTTSPIALGGHSGILTLYGSNATALVLKDVVSEGHLRFDDSNFKFTNSGGDVRMQVETDTGNVGIGTTSPSVGLQLGNNSSGQTKTAIFNSEGGGEIGLTVQSRTNRAKLRVADNDSNAYVVAEDGKAFFGTSANGDATNITVLTSGNVGIGTTSPTEALDVVGNIKASGAILGSNLSGTNTGDQDLGGYATIVSQKDTSWGESYIGNFRSRVLDQNAEYFTNTAAYEFGKLKSQGWSNRPSLVMIPSAVKDGTLFSQLPANNVGDFTVVRNSTATYTNEDGLIATALANVPRVDFTDGDGVLLTEPQRTNLITYSEDFSNSYWTKSGASIEGDPSTAGSELVTNGDFATDSDWAKNGTVTISGGTANFNNSASGNNVLQPLTLPSGKQYIATYEITSITDGKFSIYVGGVLSGNQNNQVGVYTEVFTSIGVNQVYVRARGTTNGSIDNVSVKEVQGFTSPSGDLNAFKVVNNSDTGSHHIKRTTSIAVSSSVTYTYSIYLKKGTRDVITIEDGSQVFGLASFNLTSKTATNLSGTNARIEEMSNGWFRCSVSVLSNSTGLRFTIYSGTTSSGIDDSGDYYIYGAQLELGYATSYIPTSGSTATRLADVVTDAGDVNTFNSEAGVLYVEMSIDTILGVGSDITLIDSSDSQNYIRLTNDGNVNKVNMYFKYNGISNFHTFIGDTTIMKKYAIQWGNGEVNYYVNGVLKETDSATMPPLNVFDKLHFSQSGSSNRAFTGKTKQLKVFKTALTDSELVALTSWTSFTEMANELNYNII